MIENPYLDGDEQQNEAWRRADEQSSSNGMHP